MKNLSSADIVIGAAAVGDFAPVKAEKGKIKRQGSLTLKLKPTADILAGAAAKKGKKFFAGFSAEIAGGKPRAKEKMKKKKIDLIVYNAVGNGKGFESGENTITIIPASGAEIKASGSKALLAGIKNA